MPSVPLGQGGATARLGSYVEQDSCRQSDFIARVKATPALGAGSTLDPNPFSVALPKLAG